jgi:hypothetical protein
MRFLSAAGELGLFYTSGNCCPNASVVPGELVPPLPTEHVDNSYPSGDEDKDLKSDPHEGRERRFFLTPESRGSIVLLIMKQHFIFRSRGFPCWVN